MSIKEWLLTKYLNNVKNTSLNQAGEDISTCMYEFKKKKLIYHAVAKDSKVYLTMEAKQ